MPSNDLLNRFIFDDCDIRGELVTLGESYREILSHNEYPPAIQKLLGEFLAAISLMSSTLKFDGMIILQARGDGAISTIMAECNHHNNIRGIVRLKEDAELNEQLAQNGSMQDLLGNGVLVITIEPKRAENFGGKLERYQGIVPLERETLAGCLEDYFQQSEQLATRFWFAADSQHASGFLIQSLPNQLKTNAEENKDHWETIETLADTITPEELLQLDHEQILYRLFHEQPVRVFDPTQVKFACSCSRERSESALLALGKSEVEELLIEKGSINIDCQFCNQHYHFSPEDVRKLLGGSVLH
ncbi:33 kDa chaperonin [Cellvibrio zantedeschiae]|uniref:33 kDa chaperonin n=1 Tax=Cellvibrio zantedeschiae TaxID=1237077 RepID=A0ABQ3B8A5_9GAMM|nr:Hsp33 family molecular chaperone HslO [Cellvibrio zantedeschiae]GGY83474.1 33 kDa chaperonin [Cellvibrio zantedeschiae]